MFKALTNAGVAFAKKIGALVASREDDNFFDEYQVASAVQVRQEKSHQQKAWEARREKEREAEDFQLLHPNF